MLDGTKLLYAPKTLVQTFVTFRNMVTQGLRSNLGKETIAIFTTQFSSAVNATIPKR